MLLGLLVLSFLPPSASFFTSTWVHDRLGWKNFNVGPETRTMSMDKLASWGGMVWDVEVELHGEHKVITVQPGDSILESAEMAGLTLSYECRRGNCTSCAAKILHGSSPFVETHAEKRSGTSDPEGYVLTCCSFPVGPGVKLSLGRNPDMWEDFCARFTQEETREMLSEVLIDSQGPSDVIHVSPIQPIVPICAECNPVDGYVPASSEIRMDYANKYPEELREYLSRQMPE